MMILKTNQRSPWAVWEERLAVRRQADGNAPLLVGMAAKVDARSGLIVSSEDADLLLVPWRINMCGYPNTTIKIDALTRAFRAHRIVLSRMTGRDLSPAEYGDHLNGNKLDSRRENLRLTDSHGNARNVHVVRARSGYIGVDLDNRRDNSRWRARIQTEENGKKRNLFCGWFTTAREAAIGYNQAAERLGVLTRNVIPEE